MAFSARSISLPSRPHPQSLDVDENLRRLSSAEATTSLSSRLSMLRDLYDSLEGFLQLPHTQQLLVQKNSRCCLDQLLNASLCFLDVCGTAKDVLMQTKESAQALQSMLRRKKNGPELAKEAEKYLASRKLSKKAIYKSLKELKSNCSSASIDTNNDATLSTLRRVEDVTVELFESLMSFVSGPRVSSSWSLVTKLMHSNSKQLDSSDISEFQKVDSVLHSFIRKNMDKEDVQNELRKLELRIQDLDEELDSLLRRIIRTRAFLLNILTQ